MMSHATSCALAVALCCGVAAWAPSASADPLVDDRQAEAEVEPLVQRGIELRRVGQDPAALAVFEEALAKAPGSTRVKVHLASTHQALGQWLEAERYLSDVLGNPDDPYIRRHRATLEKAYDFVDSRLGSLDVVGGPEGAELLLSGRLLGQLPLEAPVRVPVGSYTLEVRKPGYFSITRPVSISGRALLRESVELGERKDATPAWSMSGGAGEPEVEDRPSGSPSWLTWTLAGGSVAAAAVSVVAFGIREKHADNWNSDACVASGFTRGQVCPNELEKGRDAERLGIGTAILSGALLGGAVLSFALQTSDAEPERSALSVDGCGLAGAGALCFGSF